jgi:myo-inositol 2-dehydrogenase/D-chiro-inositol 1-dehydrogenase
MMIHDFDMANFIMGEAPISVMATASCVVDPEIGAAGDVDTAVVTLSYADGRIAVIKNSRRAAYGYDQRVELLGAQGLLQAQNMLENTVVKSTDKGVTGAKPTYFFSRALYGSLCSRMGKFCRCCHKWHGPASDAFRWD